MSTNRNRYDDRDADGREDAGWPAGWEAHSRQQRRRLARLTLIEKIAWLEEAQRLVAALGHQDRRDDRGLSDDRGAD